MYLFYFPLKGVRTSKTSLGRMRRRDTRGRERNWGQTSTDSHRQTEVHRASRNRQAQGSKFGDRAKVLLARAVDRPTRSVPVPLQSAAFTSSIKLNPLLFLRSIPSIYGHHWLISWHQFPSYPKQRTNPDFPLPLTL